MGPGSFFRFCFRRQPQFARAIKKIHESCMAAPRLSPPLPRAAPAESVVLPVLPLQHPRVRSCHPRVWCFLRAPQCSVWGAGPFPRAAFSLPHPRTLLWRPPWPSPGSHTTLHIITHTAPACGLVRAHRSAAGVSAGHLSMRAAPPRPHTLTAPARKAHPPPPLVPRAPSHCLRCPTTPHNTSSWLTPCIMDPAPRRPYLGRYWMRATDSNDLDVFRIPLYPSPMLPRLHTQQHTTHIRRGRDGGRDGGA
jgi:hypothetical protein